MTKGNDGARSVWLNNMSNQAVQYFEKNDMKLAAVSVPHAASPYGSAKIYVPSNAVKGRGGCVNVLLTQESYALHYNMVGEDGKQVRVHDRPVLATELQARVNARQKINLESRAKAIAEKAKMLEQQKVATNAGSFKFQFNK